MIKFAGMVTPTSVTFTGIDGKNHIISTGHPNNQRIRELYRETQDAYRGGDEINGRRLWQELSDLTDIPTALTKASAGKVTVRDGEVYYGDEVIHNSVTRRILWAMSEGYDTTPHMLFLENLLSNPSKRAVDETFEFLEACNMGITEDGFIIAYKRVKENYRDIYSGKFDNSVGQVLEMPRNKVDEDKNRTCSDGFHFCSFTYLPEFGAGPGNRIMIVKINPRDVVSIPADYNNAKARCCRYEVIGEYEGADKADVLSHKPVWQRNDVRENFNPTYGDEDEHDNGESRLDRFLQILDENDDQGSLDTSILDEDSTLGELSFYIRSQLLRIIEDDYPNAGFVNHEDISDDDMTLEELLDIIDPEDESEEHDEGSTDEVTQDEPPVPIFGAANDGGAVTGSATGQTTVYVRPVQNGAETRWVAECPSCNNGQGWTQSYARKRDARRGIKRTLGDNVAIIEQD